MTLGPPDPNAKETFTLKSVYTASFHQPTHTACAMSMRDPPRWNGGTGRPTSLAGEAREVCPFLRSL